MLCYTVSGATHRLKTAVLVQEQSLRQGNTHRHAIVVYQASTILALCAETKTHDNAVTCVLIDNLDEGSLQVLGVQLLSDEVSLKRINGIVHTAQAHIHRATA